MLVSALGILQLLVLSHTAPTPDPDKGDGTCDGDGPNKKTFPDLDYALMGYNILKGFPMAIGLDPGFTQPIFKADYSKNLQTADCIFSVPDGYTIILDVSCQTSFKSSTIQSSLDLQESMSVSAKISGGGWGVSFSASAAYSNMQHSIESGESVFVVSSASCQYYFARMHEVDPPVFDKGFIKWVKKLDKSTNDQDFQDFIDYYGTHFLKSTTFGARFLQQHSMSKKSLENMEANKIDVNAAASYSGWGVRAEGEAGYSASMESAAKSFSEVVDTQTVSVGAPPPLDGKVETWASEVHDTPVPYKYVMSSIEELFTSAFMRNLKVNADRIRKKLEKFKLSYMVQDSEDRVCRVYNSAVQFAPGICFENYNLHLSVDTECVEECLDTDACIGSVTWDYNDYCSIWLNGAPVQAFQGFIPTGAAASQLMGCYRDDASAPEFNEHVFSDPAMTQQWCIDACQGQGAVFAGVQNDRCGCLNVGPFGKYGDAGAECTTPCPGNASQICGGLNVNTVIATGVQVPSVGCSSIILPYVIAAEVPSYGMPEVPGRLTINGIRPTAYAAAVATATLANMEECVTSCVFNTDCLAVYKNTNDVVCYMYNSSQIFAATWEMNDTANDEFVFIKSCEYVQPSA